MKPIVLQVLHDDFGNKATIKEVSLKPYKGASPTTSFVLSLTADYDKGFMYHRSVFDSLKALYSALETYSCNTWH